jgi:hypothetical protein
VFPKFRSPLRPLTELRLNFDDISSSFGLNGTQGTESSSEISSEFFYFFKDSNPNLLFRFLGISTIKTSLSANSSSETFNVFKLKSFAFIGTF